MELGYRSEALDTVSLRSRIKVWLELHVEQGRVLDALGHKVGVVTAIAGLTRHKVRVTGMADRSGATPMFIRRDALCGAAEMILDLEARGTADCVGTVGIVRAESSAVHTIPGVAEFFVDIRGKGRLVAEFRAAMERRASERSLGLQIETSVDENPVPCSSGLIRAILLQLYSFFALALHTEDSGVPTTVSRRLTGKASNANNVDNRQTREE